MGLKKRSKLLSFQLKMNISRDYALCVLFGLEFTPNNVIKARSKLDSYGDLEVC